MNRSMFFRIFTLMVVLMCPGVVMSEETVPTIVVGHVGHDHQIALYAAVEEGKLLEKTAGVWFKELKPQEVYDLYDQGKLIARVNFVRVGGGAKMPAALEQGHIEVGLGGLGPVVKFIDKGAPIRVVAPLNNDGDSLLLRPGMSASTWSDFIKLVKESPKPLRIGYKDPMANAYLIFARALSEENVRFGQEPVAADGKPVQIITVNLQGDENMLPSMESGIVDGVVANEPVPSLLVHRKLGARIADLSDLPPAGKWKNHPCCVVAAGERALREKREIVKALLKAIVAGSDIVVRDRAKAFAAQAKWIKTAPEVGQMSISHVTYVSRADNVWLSAADIWLEMMSSSKAFQKNLKDKTPADIRALAFDLAPLSEALEETGKSVKR